MKTGYKNMRCALIGRHLGHSFSKPIHNELADYSYELCEIEPEEVGGFVKSSDFDAFNVTIPYKKDVIPFLDEISDEARAIGAVNTVVRKKNGRIVGYNTDYFGFSYMIDSASLDAHGKKALIIGRGGAAITVCAVLRDRGVSELVMLGSKDNTPENIEKHKDAEIIVNASPVGMFPNNGETPIDISRFDRCEYVFDLIYNPARTRLMIDAEERGIKTVCGLSMLVAQAAKAFEYFTGDKAEEGAIERITSDISKNSKNLILIGMPGCGKSTLGRMAAKALEKDFYDADDEFTKMHGITPAECIKAFGEDSFRELEHKVICELGKKSGAVIATGGGAVTRKENYAPLHQNGEIIFIERDIDKLAREGRPLSQSNDLSKMYAARLPLYLDFADASVKGEEIVENSANKIIKVFKEL